MPKHLPSPIALVFLCAGLLAGCDRVVEREPPKAVAAPAAASAPAAVSPSPAASAAPAEVAAFRQQRDQCDHFRGEDPYDAKRAAELAALLDKFCKGTDARLADLRKKYAAQPGVLQTLKDYEDHVE